MTTTPDLLPPSDDEASGLTDLDGNPISRGVEAQLRRDQDNDDE